MAYQPFSPPEPASGRPMMNITPAQWLGIVVGLAAATVGVVL